MHYLSTRGRAEKLAFDDVLLAGLARDGGLYLPESWPQFSATDLTRMATLSYADLAFEVISPFVGTAINPDNLKAIIQDAYRDFEHPAVAPLKQMGADLWIMELFHGPTLAFKDYALQLVGRLFDHVLSARDQRLTIIGATSGDTGPAAMEAVKGSARVDIFMLFPDGRTSPVQRRQMTTMTEGNVHAIAVEGTFDDCQDLVKAAFNDGGFRDEVRLSAVNSINWARVMTQIVYYFWAALSLGSPARAVSFAVPTGNFGNVLAGYAARQMGLPLDRLIVASNENDILTRFFETGAMSMEKVRPTYSPSMDIQVSSNFERFLFELLDRDGAAVESLLGGFRKTGHFSLGDNHMRRAREGFSAFRMNDPQTLEEIAQTFAQTREVLDPHSAIGFAAARAAQPDLQGPIIALATAHPAKFQDAVEKALGQRPVLPARLADLFDRPERVTHLPNDIAALQEKVRAVIGEKG